MGRGNKNEVTPSWPARQKESSAKQKAREKAGKEKAPLIRTKAAEKLTSRSMDVQRRIKANKARRQTRWDVRKGTEHPEY